jgi:predicted DNA-binding transcriptional regulator AlpA
MFDASVSKYKEAAPCTDHLPPVVDIKCAQDLTGLSAVSIFRLLRKGEFAPRVRLSPRRIGFRVVDLLAWIETRREISAPKIREIDT